MDNKSSLNFTGYNTDDFSQINVKSVCDLTAPITKMAKDGMKAIADANFSKTDIEYDGLELASYKKIICLELNEPGKENVIAAINKIRNMDGVIYAGPDYIFTEASATSPTNNTYVDNQWAIKKIQFPEAWNIAQDASEVIVGGT